MLPHVLVLGCNFAGLGAARKIREHAGDRVSITCIDSKSCLDDIPNIPLEIFEGRDPAVTMHVNVVDVLAKDRVRFQQATIEAIDVTKNTVTARPSERTGAPAYPVHYDILVIVLGAKVALHDIEGIAEQGHTVTDAFHANRQLKFLEEDYNGGLTTKGIEFTNGESQEAELNILFPNWKPNALMKRVPNRGLSFAKWATETFQF